MRDKIPELLIEVKRSDTRPAPALVNFSKRYGIPATQLVLHLKHERMDTDGFADLRILPNMFAGWFNDFTTKNIV